jgi:hypothetical protein
MFQTRLHKDFRQTFESGFTGALNISPFPGTNKLSSSQQDESEKLRFGPGPWHWGKIFLTFPRIKSRIWLRKYR